MDERALQRGDPQRHVRSSISPYEAQRAGLTSLSVALRFVWMIRAGQQVSIGVARLVMSDSSLKS
jgi:hypothetical protein